MNETVEIWFPNHQNNPGILSKVIRDNIEKKYTNFGVSVSDSYFKGSERFCFTISFREEEYREYILGEIYRSFGKFVSTTDIKKGDTYLGRLVSPGKIGFGIFVDIGLRTSSGKQDGLLPLFQLRDDLDQKSLSTRMIVRDYGLISDLPLEIEIGSDEDTSKIDLKLTQNSITFLRDLRQGNDKLLISRTFTSSVQQKIRELDLQAYIEEISEIDPLTTLIHCKRRTNGTGLIPKLGSKLSRAPIGLIRPEK